MYNDITWAYGTSSFTANICEINDANKAVYIELVRSEKKQQHAVPAALATIIFMIVNQGS